MSEKTIKLRNISKSLKRRMNKKKKQSIKYKEAPKRLF